MTDQGKKAYKMYIDGAWVDALDGTTIEVIDPATEESIATVAYGAVEDARVAIMAARRAFDDGPWPRMSVIERSDLLIAAAAKLRERGEDIARLETLEMGKLFGDAQGDIGDTLSALETAARAIAGHHGEQVNIAAPEAFAAVAREPVGVVVGITPWNFPLMLASWKFAFALAAGNVVIMKPATISPLTTLEMARIFEEVGIPAGVFQVLVGPGGSVGDELSSSPLVDMVTLTGSLEVGRQVMRNAAVNIKKVGLELGGKSPNIVFADADAEAAVQGALWGAFANAGQVCSAGSRVLVERAIYDDFLSELVKRANAIKVGPGLDPESEMGPLSSAAQLATTERYVAIGLKEGARLACGGKRIQSEKGCYFQPTIFADVDNKMIIAQEEIFGPVLVVIPFEDEKEAVSIANDTIYGLAAGVWSKDASKAMRVARALQAGMVWVNTFFWSPAELPWGGYKQSGLGREMGSFGLDEFTEVKSIIVDTTGEPIGLYTAD